MSENPGSSRDALMTEADVARRLNLAVGTLQSWRITGKGPEFVKLGRAVRYRPEDIERFVQASLTAGAREDRDG